MIQLCSVVYMQDKEYVLQSFDEINEIKHFYFRHYLLCVGKQGRKLSVGYGSKGKVYRICTYQFLFHL